LNGDGDEPVEILEEPEPPALNGDGDEPAT